MRVHNIGAGTMASLENPKLSEITNGRPEKTLNVDTVATTGNQPESREFSRDELEQAVEQLNNTMQSYSTNLQFEVHEKSGEIMVKVLNSEDGSVIREIPPEKILDMVAYFKEMLGLIIDKMF